MDAAAYAKDAPEEREARIATACGMIEMTVDILPVSQEIRTRLQKLVDDFSAPSEDVA